MGRFAFYPQTITVSLSSSQSQEFTEISVPDGMAYIIYEIKVFGVNSASAVTFKFSGIPQYFGAGQLYNNDILPINIKPIPYLISKGGDSIVVEQQSTPISSTNRFLLLGVVCNIQEVDEAIEYIKAHLR